MTHKIVGKKSFNQSIEQSTDRNKFVSFRLHVEIFFRAKKSKAKNGPFFKGTTPITSENRRMESRVIQYSLESCQEMKLNDAKRKRAAGSHIA